MNIKKSFICILSAAVMISCLPSAAGLGTEAVSDGKGYSWVLEPFVVADDIFAADYSPDDEGEHVDKVKQYAYIQIDGKYGLVDYEGNIAAEPVYDGCSMKDAGGMDDRSLNIFDKTTEDGCYTDTFENITFYEKGARPGIGGISCGYMWSESEKQLYTVMNGERVTGKNESDKSCFAQSVKLKTKMNAKEYDLTLENCEIKSGFGLARNNELLVDTVYSYVSCYSTPTLELDTEYFAFSRDSKKWDIFDENGKMIVGDVEPFECRRTRLMFWTPLRCSNDKTEKKYDIYMIPAPFLPTEGVVAIKKDGRYGYISTDGEEIVPLGTFEKVNPLHYGKAWVKYKGKWGVISLGGYGKENPESKSVADYPVGSVLEYGKWEEEPIKWRVIENNSTEMTLITTKCLFAKKFHDVKKYDYGPTDWEHCTLRSWLNSDFHRDAFNFWEKENIICSDVPASQYKQPDGENYAYGGEDTKDYVWILSREEAEELLPKRDDRLVEDYKYVDKENRDRQCTWWLRTPYLSGSSVNVSGTKWASTDTSVVDDYKPTNADAPVFSYGRNDIEIGVRPVIKVSFKSDSADSEEPPAELDYGGEKNEKTYELDKMIDLMPSTDYNPKLAHILMTLSAAAYFGDSEGYMTINYKALGFDVNDPEKYSGSRYYSQSGQAFGFGACFGRKRLIDGRDEILIVLREEKNKTGRRSVNIWENLGLGSECFENGRHTDYEAVKNKIYNELENFLGGAIPKDNVRYVITGYSRGAAAANLLALQLSEDGVKKELVYDYNFACPDVAAVPVSKLNPKGGHDNMFNISNREDIVSFMPNLYRNTLGQASAEQLVAPWGKFGRSYWFASPDKGWDGGVGDDMFETSCYHDYNTYLSYLRSLPEIGEFKTFSEMEPRKTLSGLDNYLDGMNGIVSKCPVNVVVKNSRDETVVSVVNNRITLTDPGDTGYAVYTVDDEKYIFLRNDDEYTLEMIAAADGTMDTYIFPLDDNGDEPDCFENISMKKGQVFSALIHKGEPGSVKLVSGDTEYTAKKPEHNDKNNGGSDDNGGDKAIFIIMYLLIAAGGLLIIASVVIVLIIIARKGRAGK